MNELKALIHKTHPPSLKRNFAPKTNKNSVKKIVFPPKKPMAEVLVGMYDVKKRHKSPLHVFFCTMAQNFLPHYRTPMIFLFMKLKKKVFKIFYESGIVVFRIFHIQKKHQYTSAKVYVSIGRHVKIAAAIFVF